MILYFSNEKNLTQFLIICIKNIKNIYSYSQSFIKSILIYPMLIGILLSVLLSGQLVEPKPKGNSYYSPSDTTMLNAESFPTNYTFENDSEM